MEYRNDHEKQHSLPIISRSSFSHEVPLTIIVICPTIRGCVDSLVPSRERPARVVVAGNDGYIPVTEARILT